MVVIFDAVANYSMKSKYVIGSLAEVCEDVHDVMRSSYTFYPAGMIS